MDSHSRRCIGLISLDVGRYTENIVIYRPYRLIQYRYHFIWRFTYGFFKITIMWCFRSVCMGMQFRSIHSLFNEHKIITKFSVEHTCIGLTTGDYISIIAIN